MKKSTASKALWLGLSMTGFFSTTANATGVEAGTEVINAFTLNYKSGTIDRPQVDNLADPTRFIVDNRVDLTTVDNSTGVSGTPDQLAYNFEFKVTNLGNKDTNFSFSATDNGGDFTLGSPTPFGYWIDLNNDGIRQTSTEPFINISSAPEPLIPQDISVFVAVRASIPDTAQDGETGEILFTATASDGSGTPLTSDSVNTLLGEETLLDDGSGATDGDADAAYNATSAVTIETAVLTGNKTVAMLSPEACDALTETSNPPAYNTPTPDTAGNFAIPGACAEYTITVTNIGSAPATDIVLTDVLDDGLILHRMASAGFSVQRGSTGFLGSVEAAIEAGISDGAGGLMCDGTASTCDGAFSNARLGAGETGTLTYRVIVNKGSSSARVTPPPDPES